MGWVARQLARRLALMGRYAQVSLRHALQWTCRCQSGRTKGHPFALPLPARPAVIRHGWWRTGPVPAAVRQEYRCEVSTRLIVRCASTTQLWEERSDKHEITQSLDTSHAGCCNECNSGAGIRADAGQCRRQWQACKQQADDKKLDRGDARKSFMRDCLKAAGKDTGKDAGQQNPGA
jgi:hypothetical protein